MTGRAPSWTPRPRPSSRRRADAESESDAFCVPDAEPEPDTDREPVADAQPDADPDRLPDADGIAAPSAGPTATPTATPTARRRHPPRRRSRPRHRRRRPTPAPTPPPGGDLVGTSWQLTSFTTRDPVSGGDVPAAERFKYTASFAQGGTFSATADCNTLVGTWTATATGGLAIVPGASSIVICGEGSYSDVYILAFTNSARLRHREQRADHHAPGWRDTRVRTGQVDRWRRHTGGDHRRAVRHNAVLGLADVRLAAPAAQDLIAARSRSGRPPTSEAGGRPPRRSQPPQP